MDGVGQHTHTQYRLQSQSVFFACALCSLAVWWVVCIASQFTRAVAWSAVGCKVARSLTGSLIHLLFTFAQFLATACTATVTAATAATVAVSSNVVQLTVSDHFDHQSLPGCIPTLSPFVGHLLTAKLAVTIFVCSTLYIVQTCFSCRCFFKSTFSGG